MMKMHTRIILFLMAAASLVLFSARAQAATMHIAFTGMDLAYNGSVIHDATNIAGGGLNPAQADPLATMTFFDSSNNVVGTLNSNIFLDLFIPDVTGIADAGSTTVITPGNPGFADLLIGSPIASEFLALDLSEVTVTYNNIFNIVQFAFGAAVADIGGQNLPFGLQIGDPVTVSFNAQLTSKVAVGGVVTQFTATGSGDVFGTQVPEPATAALVLLCALGMAGFAGRRR